MVDGMCDGGADAWPTTLPWGEWYRPVGGDHQSSRDAITGAN